MEGTISPQLLRVCQRPPQGCDSRRPLLALRRHNRPDVEHLGLKHADGLADIVMHRLAA
jgi:hypothetical protein